MSPDAWTWETAQTASASPMKIWLSAYWLTQSKALALLRLHEGKDFQDSIAQALGVSSCPPQKFHRAGTGGVLLPSTKVPYKLQEAWQAYRVVLLRPGDLHIRV